MNQLEFIYRVLTFGLAEDVGSSMSPDQFELLVNLAYKSMYARYIDQYELDKNSQEMARPFLSWKLLSVKDGCLTLPEDFERDVSLRTIKVDSDLSVETEEESPSCSMVVTVTSKSGPVTLDEDPGECAKMLPGDSIVEIYHETNSRVAFRLGRSSGNGYGGSYNPNKNGRYIYENIGKKTFKVYPEEITFAWLLYFKPPEYIKFCYKEVEAEEITDKCLCLEGGDIVFDPDCSTDLCLPEANLHELAREVARLAGIADINPFLISSIERLQTSV